MATAVKQDSIFIRIDSEEKKQIEAICNDMGITPASAAKMFFKQLVKERKFPFTPKATEIPWALQPHSEKEIAEAIRQSEEDIKKGKVYSEDQFKEIIKEL